MTFTVPEIHSTPLTNKAFGYPHQGDTRRVKPPVLLCLHISGNRRTAAANATRGEVAYTNRKGSGGPSAHNYVDRNGVVFNCIDPDKFAAWSNGDLTRPNTALPAVANMVAQRAKGINANELVYREIECTGYPGSFPVTDAQIESVAYLLARDSIKTGLPIVRGVTVLTHADINSVNRSNCAFTPKERESRLTMLIQRAKAIKAEIKNPPPPDPPVEPPDPCADANAALDAAEGVIDALTTERNEWVAYADAVAATPRPDAP